MLQYLKDRIIDEIDDANAYMAKAVEHKERFAIFKRAREQLFASSFEY